MLSASHFSFSSQSMFQRDLNQHMCLHIISIQFGSEKKTEKNRPN